MQGANRTETEAVFEVQFLIDLPGILCEGLPRKTAPDVFGTYALFGIGIGEAQRKIRQPDARCAAQARAGVGE
jgi:hypothetical protein